MYELTIELVSKGTRWDFAKREIRVGRDHNCDLILPTDDYPMVSRSHLLIRLAAERYWVEDLNTPGGTSVNGERIQLSPLSHGDVLQLGTNGPQLRVYINTSRRAEAAQTPVRRSSASEEPPTRLYREPPAKNSVEEPTTKGKWPRASQLPEDASARIEPAQQAAADVPLTYVAPGESEGKAPPSTEFPTPSPDRAVPVSVSRDAAPRAPSAEMTPGKAEAARTAAEASAPGSSSPAPEVRLPAQDMATMERRLSTLRNLLILMIILVMILGCIVVYQNRIIARNREELADIKKNVVESILPRLDQRLKEFEVRLDKFQSMQQKVDAKVK